MLDESYEEDCTIYIEELKSDDANLKMNAVQKVTSIANIIGPVRVCEELVPYLIEIIEEQDNEDEFLIRLCEEIYKLKEFIGQEEKSYVLISPLEILSSMEESLIREKAVNCLIRLAEGQNQNFFENHFFQIVLQLGQWDNFPSRISACSLIPVIFPQIQEQKQQQLWDLYMQLCSDDTPMVRKTCALIMNQLAVLETIKLNDNLKNLLLEQWQKLLKDKIDTVKICAIEATPSNLRLMIGRKGEINQHLKAYFQLAGKQEKSWRVRYAVPEILPTIIKYLDKDLMKQEAIPALESLLKDTEQEVRSISIQSSYSLLSELPSTATQMFIPIFSQLTQDPSPHVRLSLAESISKLATIYSSDIVSSQIIPIITLIFKDDVQDARIKISHNLPQLASLMGPELSKIHILPFVKNFQNEKQWRVRLEIISVIPKLIKVIGWDTYQELYETIHDKGALNHYQAIRDQIIENFIVLKDIFGYERLRIHIRDLFNQLSTQRNYIYRVTCLHAFVKLKSTLSQPDLNSLFEVVFNLNYRPKIKIYKYNQEISSKLLQDPVPNVRLNVFKTYSQIFDKLDNKQRAEFARKAEKLEDDPDNDVSYYASNYRNLN